MKKFKKFCIELFTLLLVVIPVALLAGGLWLSTGPVWDILMLAGILGVLVFSWKKYLAVRRQEERVENARALVAIVGTGAAFFALAAQLIFCRLGAPYGLLTEAAMVWMFILMATCGINALKEDTPNSRVLSWAIVFSIAWILICAVGGMFDIYEFFSGQEIPERLGNLLGVLAPLTGIGAFVLMIVGIIKENCR